MRFINIFFEINASVERIRPLYFTFLFRRLYLTKMLSIIQRPYTLIGTLIRHMALKTCREKNKQKEKK